MYEKEKFERAIQKFDEANSRDPNRETEGGRDYPKELLYARRMTECLQKINPHASEVLRLAARCQHLERWVIPRETFPKTRPGYIKWRNELKKVHAKRAEEILKDVGYGDETISRVKKLVLKKGLKTDPEVQMLEDTACLVFLEHYFEEFANHHNEEKLISILQKTWRKMSENGQQKALELELPGRSIKLIEKALG